MNYSKDTLKYRFSEWQKREIYTDHFGDISKHYLIQLFVDNGIMPFLRRYKYDLLINMPTLKDTIASLLFHLERDRYYIFPLLNDKSFNDEYYYHFEHMLDWNSFWLKWNKSTNNYFRDYTMEIQTVLWDFINMKTSEPCIKIYNDTKESEDEAKDDIHIDPYIADQRAGHGHY